MAKKKKLVSLSKIYPPKSLLQRIKPPFAIILGSPSDVVNLLQSSPHKEAVCYQMDLFQAARLEHMLQEANLPATVRVEPDLWNIGNDFASAVYLPARSGERELKIDMVEQGFHILKDSGLFLIWSAQPNESLFPPVLKKIYKKVHIHQEGDTTFLWCQKSGERPRRRHEVTFQCRVSQGESMRFLSRPGTFSYGKFDAGSRALCEVMSLRTGQNIVDLGCGCGTNGIFASKKVGPDAKITFVDSNLRALELAKINAEANGLTNFEIVATASVTGPSLTLNSFDIALANPPYFANHSIALLFIQRSYELLKRSGSFFMVTKQPNEMVQLMTDANYEVEGAETRGYTVLMHRGPAAREDMEAISFAQEYSDDNDEEPSQ